ncbi:suppressor of fused domain protein [Actinoplanes aureus]|uniref:Suppressor of fused domain protein n=1 Tax=Actinoplanes aureus TaxID=2792083 RepID=A0A931G543_9ACTN|nr:suppressor of fused domain protein [Actinoplanes aureus]MBG0565889.1 suppressor of fused domain protein [Actinoplanes aureus]
MTSTEPGASRGQSRAVRGLSEPGVAAPGRDAIDAALARLYPGVEPRHVTFVPAAESGSTLHGCSAFPADGHWHYVTYGLSELYGKSEDDDPDWSGWGFELTMRAARDGEAEPPRWPFALLHRAATFVNSRGALLDAGDRIDVDPVLVFARDPLLGEIDTPNGKVVFLEAAISGSAGSAGDRTSSR